MKKTLLITTALLTLIVLSINVFSANGDVYIIPQHPLVGDILTCGIEGATNNYNYYWYVNGIKVKSDYGKQSTLNTDNYHDGDLIGCDAYIPNINAYVGSASVVLEAPYNDIPVNVDFTSNVSEGEAPLNVRFFCNTTGNSPFEYTIKTGDGYTKTIYSSENSIFLDYTYNNSGTYYPTCKVMDSDGDYGIANTIITVYEPYNDIPVNVDLNVTPNSGEAPLTINYECNAEGNEPIAYIVDFGDGTTSTQNVGTHTYDNVRNYTVTCTAEDYDGDTNYDSKLVSVIQGYHDILASVNVNMNYTYVTYNRVDITAECNINGNAPYTYFVYFDGTQIDSGVTMNNNLVYTFANKLIGTHEFKCEVFDYDNDYAEDEMRIEIPEQDIDFTNIHFVVNPKVGDAPLTVHYDCNAYGGNFPVSYIVDFGDGTTSTQNVGTHTYNNAGNYTITCTATDRDNDTISKSEIITVYEPYNDIPVNVDLNISPIGNFPYVPIDMIAVCAYTGNSPYKVTIDYGLGIRNYTTNNNGVSTTITYNNPGTYTITCTVEDNDGDVNSKSYTFTLYDQNTTWSINASPLQGEAPLLVFFDSNTSSFGNVTLNWDFGDGHYAVGKQVKHLFVKPGDYVVKAYFTDKNGVYFEKFIVIRVTEKTVMGEEINYNDFRIKHLMAYKGYNSILVSVTAENFVGEDLKDFTITAYFPYSGYEATQHVKLIKNHDWETITFEVPLSLVPYEDVAIIKVYNDKINIAKKTFII